MTIATEPSDDIAEVVDRTLKDLDELAEGVAVLFGFELDSIPNIDAGELRGLLLAAAKRQVRIVLHAIAEQRNLDAVELEMFRRFGDSRLDASFTNVALLHSNHGGFRLVRKALVQATANIEDASRRVNTRSVIARQMISLMAQLSSSFATRRAQTPSSITAVNSTFVALLEGFEQTDRLDEIAHSIGLGPASGYAVAVASLEGNGRVGLSTVMTTSLARFGCRGIVRAIGNLTAAVVEMEGARDTSSIERALKATLANSSIPGARAIAGIGRIQPGLTGITLSYRQAGQALDVARSIYGRDVVLRFEEALPYSLLRADPPAALEIMDMMVTPLIQYDENRSTQLLDTIRTLVGTGGHLAETARALGIHRHTLTDRISRIDEILGFEILNPDRLLLASLALKASDLLGTGQSPR